MFIVKNLNFKETKNYTFAEDNLILFFLKILKISTIILQWNFKTFLASLHDPKKFDSFSIELIRANSVRFRPIKEKGSRVWLYINFEENLTKMIKYSAYFKKFIKNNNLCNYANESARNATVCVTKKKTKLLLLQH